MRLFEWGENYVWVSEAWAFIWASASEHVSPCYMYQYGGGGETLGQPGYRRRVDRGLDGLEFLT